ncbi:MAG: hypothetical protein KA783_03900 [Chitinophagales bacterium]|jgi:hypothetical protein|nr:hypothetical protein [Sphingobacteriales bacterium]MBP7533565.1 hypothetical protein [Chitinophagales bacterium]
MKKQPKTKAKLHPDEFIIIDDNNGYESPEQLKLILEILAQNPDMDEKNNPPKRKNTSTFRSH